MTVRIVETQEADVIAPLSRPVQTDHHERRPDWFKPYDAEMAASEVRKILAQSGARGLVAYVDDTPAGYAILTTRERHESGCRHADRTLEIDQMSVEREFRRTGVGSALIDRARQIAEDEKYDRIRLTVWSNNPDAKAFYASQDFQPRTETLEWVT